jgi:hypothetical protein
MSGYPALPSYLQIGISNLFANETSLGHGLDKNGARVVLQGQNLAMGLNGMHGHHHSSHLIFLPSFLPHIRSLSHHRYTFFLSFPL